MRVVAVSVLILLGVVQAQAGALTSAPAERGRALAARLCSNCHLTAASQQHANVDVPSFREIANKEGQTEGAIVARIVLPKHPMPVVPLSKPELADLAAYIMSLKEPVVE
jgi:mono/diheme cytochrome c family protein